MDEIKELFSGKFWTSKNELIRDFENNGYSVDDLNDEYITVSDEDDNEYSIKLIIAKSTIALDLGSVIEEDIFDDYEYSDSRFSRFFTPDVNKFIQKNYTSKKIEKFDNYIETLMRESGLGIDDLRVWDSKWVAKIMREAERK